ncbi:MAG: serine hydrolase [Acidobacteria bacterium]|nr:serine hydrolase [Acidobacteriota bacterium]MBI3489665.1 serine hydrolase [Acidobacteriota bacterium]
MRLSLPALLVCLALPAAAQIPQATLDQVVEKARSAFHVPGLAVAVVKDGKVTVSKGYGVMKEGGREAVTPQTLFGIASNTKVFTAAALAILVDEGKLGWEDRVVDRLPGFQMSDAYVTREMRIRDLLCHRSGLGLGAGDLMFFPSTDLKPEEILHRLRFVPLATSFRSEYAYDNLLYLVAGAVIERVSGSSWADFLRERIFRPAGMASTRARARDLRPGDPTATPHAPLGDGLAPVALGGDDNIAPAGSILSSAEDMARWAGILLAKGDLGGGKRLFSEAQARILWTPLTLIPSVDLPESLREMASPLTAYAMGEVVQEYRGQAMVWHTGGLPGMVSRVTFLPGRKLAVVVLTNAESTAAFHAITHAVLDRDLGAPAKDWVETFRVLRDASRAASKAAVQKDAARRAPDSHPSLPLASYAGRYRDPWYGDILVEQQEGALAIRFTHTPGLTGRLEHFQQDSFIARWNDRTLDADAYLTFALNPDGTVAQARMKAVSPTTDFSYDFHDLVLTPVKPGDAVKAW